MRRWFSRTFPCGCFQPLFGWRFRHRLYVCHHGHGWWRKAVYAYGGKAVFWEPATPYSPEAEMVRDEDAA